MSSGKLKTTRDNIVPCACKIMLHPCIIICIFKVLTERHITYAIIFRNKRAAYSG